MYKKSMQNLKFKIKRCAKQIALFNRALSLPLSLKGVKATIKKPLKVGSPFRELEG
jgi:hypothetical protein